MTENTLPHIQIFAVGDEKAGKTSLLCALKGDPLPDDYEPKIFDNIRETREFEGKKYLIHLRDTTGQESYNKIRPLNYSQCMFCYYVLF